MPRVKIPVDPQKLKLEIDQLENQQQFQNRSELFAALAATDWAKRLNLTPSVIYLRVNEFGINLKTPLGKKGNPALKGGGGKRKERVATSKVSKAITALGKLYKREKLAAKVLTGSLAGAIKMKCIDCTNNNTKEIAKCESIDCPLYLVRPYQSNKQDLEDGDDS